MPEGIDWRHRLLVGVHPRLFMRGGQALVLRLGVGVVIRPICLLKAILLAYMTTPSHSPCLIWFPVTCKSSELVNSNRDSSAAYHLTAQRSATQHSAARVTLTTNESTLYGCCNGFAANLEYRDSIRIITQQGFERATGADTHVQMSHVLL